ncbi:23S rRNA (uracil(1939)-C(5))-methyltransferase RlmD [Patescibacteria group bacterium]
MKHGETRTIVIESVDKKGCGRGQVNERPASVRFALPGETVEASYVGRGKGVKRFRVDRLVEASPHRTEPRCPNAGRCGGCAWQHVDYAHQLELKRGLVNAAFERAGLQPPVAAVEPCPQLYHYRNRMDWCVGPQGQIGLKEPGRWNAYLNIEECHLQSPEAMEVLATVRGWMKDNGVKPWNAFHDKGYLRYVVVREGKNTGERLVTLVTHRGDLPARNDLIERLAPYTTSVWHGVNPEVTDLSVAPKTELVAGAPHLVESVGNFRYQIGPNSFFQTNTTMAERLLSAVREHVTEARPETVLDLYCGVGFFTVGIADLVRRAVGVELDDQAVSAARRNALLNGAANTEFAATSAESLVWERERPDLVIVDPPRAGLHPKVASTLLERAPRRIVYVSCNYESFVRDFGALGTQYDLTSLQALDLFPHSPHVELVTLLERQ